jgi:hypothetical protein
MKMRIELSSLPKSELIDELEAFLTSMLPEVAIGREGKALRISDDAVSRNEAKFLVRKFLGRAGLRKTTRVIAEGDDFKVHYKEQEKRE